MLKHQWLYDYTVEPEIFAWKAFFAPYFHAWMKFYPATLLSHVKDYTYRAYSDLYTTWAKIIMDARVASWPTPWVDRSFDQRNFHP